MIMTESIRSAATAKSLATRVVQNTSVHLTGRILSVLLGGAGSVIVPCLVEALRGHRGPYVTNVRNCLSRSIKLKKLLRRYFTGRDTKSSLSFATTVPIGTDGI